MSPPASHQLPRNGELGDPQELAVCRAGVLGFGYFRGCLFVPPIGLWINPARYQRRCRAGWCRDPHAVQTAAAVQFLEMIRKDAHLSLPRETHPKRGRSGRRPCVKSIRVQRVGMSVPQELAGRILTRFGLVVSARASEKGEKRRV
jgi:hypothetical protein